jgi:Lrp/AsnC family transcriptional regulator for asnA, asnC and gidA
LQENISIDLIDARILKMLLKESRTRFTEIAKECKISVGAVKMRYNHLKKAGVINGEIMLINPYSLGYKCIGNLGINTFAEKREEVMEFLRKKAALTKLYYSMDSWGKYNIGLLVAKKSIEEWGAELHRLETIPHIKLVDPLIWITPIGLDHPENLEIKPLENKKQENTVEKSPITINYEQIKIDEVDRQIVKILVHSSRTSFRKIAKQLNISTKKVIQRYKKLRENLLTFSTITLDLKKLGYNAMVSIFVKGERSKMQEIANKMLQIPNIIVFIRLIGSYDLLAVAALEDFRSLIRLQKEIHAIKGIEQIDFSIHEPFPAWPANAFAPLL